MPSIKLEMAGPNIAIELRVLTADIDLVGPGNFRGGIKSRGWNYGDWEWHLCVNAIANRALTAVDHFVASHFLLNFTHLLAINVTGKALYTFYTMLASIRSSCCCCLSAGVIYLGTGYRPIEARYELLLEERMEVKRERRRLAKELEGMRQGDFAEAAPDF